MTRLGDARDLTKIRNMVEFRTDGLGWQNADKVYITTGRGEYVGSDVRVPAVDQETQTIEYLTIPMFEKVEIVREILPY